ncbi:MAG: hypothetical protein ACLT1W_16445 [Alistipes onderdonkii]
MDTDKFKIYSLSIMEGETLSDNLFLVTVKLVNKDDQAFSQSYYMNGLEPTDLRDVQSTFEAPEYETTVGIDLSELDPARIAAQIAQAKTMLPEGHSYKSVGRYEIEEEVPAGNSAFNRNRKPGQQHTSFIVRFTEDGKETSSAGKTSYILRSQSDRGAGHAHDQKIKISSEKAGISRFLILYPDARRAFR